MFGFRYGLGLALLPTACGPAVATGEADGSSTSEDGTSSTGAPPSPSTTAPVSTTTTTTAEGSGSDSSGGSSSTTGSDTGPGCLTDGCMIDVVVVVDNSSGMAGAQQALARSMIELDAQLRSLEADVQVMFTTTDVGNQYCTPFQPQGYAPAMGAPITTACTERLQDFVGLGTNPPDTSEACTAVCPEPLAPGRDPFVAFAADTHNLPQEGSVDLDGDGQIETATAQALACMAPMGINGCGFESPLEAMLQALNPSASWNQGPRPFLRDGAAVGVVLVGNELDCSVRDTAMMSNPDLYEINPDTGMPALSSAVCWNAGIDCIDQGEGTYDCAPNGAENLQPIDRYTAYFDYLSLELDKPVLMLGLLGVPPVTERNPEPPFDPIAGGTIALEVRDWTDDDVSPEDADAGVTAADLQFAYGIGPGCSEPQSTTVRQAIPPLRSLAVCDHISPYVNEDGQSLTRCCVESICDDDYTAGMRCIAGMFAIPDPSLGPKG